MNNRVMNILISCLFFVLVSSAAFADEEVGRVVALRGKASIQRDRISLDATLKMGIQSRDTVLTGTNARAKLLFVDDSVLTLGDNSRLVVKEFIGGKGKEGKSIFNLMDGKMRSVVGKTRFEVQTPTAVASARGTVIIFEVGLMGNRPFSKISCLEGSVWVRSSDVAVPGEVILYPGTMVIVMAGEPLPEPSKIPPGEEGNAEYLGTDGSLLQQDPGSLPIIPPIEVPGGGVGRGRKPGGGGGGGGGGEGGGGPGNGGGGGDGGGGGA
jgi:uncharacterized membrane protein YgcG